MKIDAADVVLTEKHVEDSVFGCLTQSHGVATEGFANVKHLARIVNASLGLNGPNNRIGIVFDHWQSVREAARTHTITASRYF